MWLLPLFGLIIGIILGTLLNFQIPPVYIKYLSIAVLASLDSVMGGIRSALEENFDATVLLTGFFTNATLAALLAYLGDRLGVDLYYAAVFVFGVRLFQNLASIRHALITRWRDKRKRRGEAEQ